MAINLLGLGLTSFLFRTYFVSTGNGVDIVPSLRIPVLSDIPYLGVALFQQNLLVYTTIPHVIAARYLVLRTSYGLTIRAVGEHPKAVEVAGKSVALYRYSAVLIGGLLAGLGGAYLTLAHANQFVENITSAAASSRLPSSFLHAGRRSVCFLSRCCLDCSTRCNCSFRPIRI